jgi:hypothetical protein
MNNPQPACLTISGHDRRHGDFLCLHIANSWRRRDTVSLLEHRKRGGSQVCPVSHNARTSDKCCDTSHCRAGYFSGRNPLANSIPLHAILTKLHGGFLQSLQFNLQTAPSDSSRQCILNSLPIVTGHAVAQFVEALRHKSEGRGFDFRWNVSLT